ncbi:MAG: ABC transporter permease [Acidothermaceae bacterium]
MSIGSIPAVRSYSFWVAQYRRTWRGSVVSSVVSPVMYLAAMGVGLGSIVKSGHATGGLSYLQFVAPGLLAATAMQAGSQESTYPVLGSFKWIRNYHAMAATPLTPRDILVGHLMWIAARVSMVAGIYLAIVAAFGAARSALAVVALPVCLLVGLAFATPIVAYSATRETDYGFAALQRFAIMPMFLFSGTFFSVSQLPWVIRPIAWITPLWHGVSLCRDLTTGRLEAGGWPLVVVHIGYLFTVTAIGYFLSLRFFRARLAV